MQLLMLMVAEADVYVLEGKWQFADSGRTTNNKIRGGVQLL